MGSIRGGGGGGGGAKPPPVVVKRGLSPPSPPYSYALGCTTYIYACVFSNMWVPISLGTRPSKNRKGGSGTSAGVDVYTAPGMKAHFRLAFD